MNNYTCRPLILLQRVPEEDGWGKEEVLDEWNAKTLNWLKMTEDTLAFRFFQRLYMEDAIFGYKESVPGNFSKWFYNKDYLMVRDELYKRRAEFDLDEASLSYYMSKGWCTHVLFDKKRKRIMAIPIEKSIPFTFFNGGIHFLAEIKNIWTPC